MTTLHLVSLNVNGLQNDTKRRAIFNWLRSSKYDIIFLQETHCHLGRDEKRWSLEWDGKCIWNGYTCKSRGVAVLFNRNYVYDFQNVFCDKNGRFIVFDLNICDVKYRMINVYAPNHGGERRSFYKNIESYVVDDYENLVAGDFNCCLNTFNDRKNCTASLDTGKAELENLMNKFALEDVWRRRNPEKNEYSWRRGQRASRIDFWLISLSLDNQVDKVRYNISPFSDHCSIELKFRTSEVKRGKGIWKMNIEILQNETFRQVFLNWWKSWKTKQHEYSNLGIWWDLAKKKIKDISISVSKMVSDENKMRIRYLEKSILDFENATGRTSKNDSDLQSMKCELRKIYEKRGEGARVRSRINWFEKGETSSRYFHALEKRNAKDKLWNKILDEKGEMRHGTLQVIDTQVEYYSELYKSEQIDRDEAKHYLDGLENSLTDELRKYLDSDIEITEVRNAVMKMKNNKSPGPDGIPIEFYKYYWDEIATDLLQVYESSYQIQELPQSQYQAIIRLLFKKGQRENIKNWRPISLLNSDSKILTKLLAERLKYVLPRIINIDQKGCVKGRFIGENIRLIEDIMDSCEEEEVIVLLDQQKAFDRVEHEWLFMTLNKFGFGEKFQTWLKILYKSMKSAILTNGYVSRYFPVNRGIRQGDSLSALLYIIQSEPLNTMIKNTNDIKGIEIQGYICTKEVKSKQYVDDTFVCLKDANQIKNCLKIIDNFGKASGSKVNKEKTIGLVVKNPKFVEELITLSTGPAKVLGIEVGTGSPVIWQNLLERVKKKLKVWGSRNLSLAGKVHVIKSLGMSTILYASNMKTVPHVIIDDIEKLFYEFLWEGKRAKVRKQICTLPKSLGGIGMIDLRTAIKVQRIKWVLRILNSSAGDDWNIIPIKHLKCLDKKFNTEFFALRAYDSTSLLKNKNIPLFYRECIEYFQELNRKGKLETCNDIIWCNNRLLFNGEPLNFAHWAQSGILRRRDIIQDGKIIHECIYKKLIHKASYLFDLHKLKACIPNSWLKQHVNENEVDLQSINDVILNEKFEIPTKESNKSLKDLTSKEIYDILLLKSPVEIKSKRYWEQKFVTWQSVDPKISSTINFDQWFANNFCNKLNPRKCNDFNWKIFHGVVMVEQRLSKMNLSDGICVMCKKELENTEHLLYYCERLGDLWFQIQIFINKLFDKEFKLNVKSVIVGNLDNNDDDCGVFNMILSITRFTIWKRRNNLKFENTEMSEAGLYRWILGELKNHCLVLVNTKYVKSNLNIQKWINKMLFLMK